ncbi:hypothetical protein BJV78DRAFT_238747 [Lactifluus subvellereus]|nr:hypothetical protein BJV78DRAFT_238747 [Lactifluus subvellereus]
MNDLLQEWKDILIPSTVMLSVTVSYLTIPGTILSNLNNVTIPSQVIIFTSPAQIASTLSIVASVGSIVIDLLLIRYTSTKPKSSSASSSPYQYQRSHTIFGNESMAIVFSLPWALLMWSMVLFFAALLLSSFTHSNAPTRISVVAMSAIVACLTVWSLLTAWRANSDRVKRFALSIFGPRLPRAHRTLHRAGRYRSLAPDDSAP